MVTTFAPEQTIAPLIVKETPAVKINGNWEALVILLPSESKLTPPRRNVELRTLWKCPQDLIFPLGIHMGTKPINIADELISIVEGPIIEDNIQNHVKRQQWESEIIDKQPFEIQSLYRANLLKFNRFQTLLSCARILNRRGLIEPDWITKLDSFVRQYQDSFNGKDNTPNLQRKKLVFAAVLRNHALKLIRTLAEKQIDYEKVAAIR